MLRTTAGTAVLLAAIGPTSASGQARPMPRAAARATTLPAHEAEMTAADVALAVRRLADADPETRAAGRFDLMGLTPEQLPLLRDAVRAAGAVGPETGEVLRDVVSYVIARDRIGQVPRSTNSLLGVRWMAGSDDGDDATSGVPVEVRLPGFVAARYLREGDRVFALLENGQMTQVTSRSDLSKLILTFSPGDEITLMVRRGTRMLPITLPLDCFPNFGGNDLIEQQTRLTELLNAAQEAATAYYEKNFAPLLPQT